MAIEQAPVAPAAPAGPAEPYRTLIVDDSAVIRGLLRRILDADPGITVVGAAGNGQVAVDFVKREPVEVVVLDIEMPVLNGLDALPQIVGARPNAKVIMASTLTRRGAAVSIEALARGASDFIPKPTATRELGEGQDFARELCEKVKGLGAAARGATAATDRAATPAPRGPKAAPSGAPSVAGQAPGATSKSTLYGDAVVSLRKPGALRPLVLAIGASTGGPQALFKLLGEIAADIDLPIVITQHMPATFTTILAEHISKVMGRPCHEGSNGALMRQGSVYLAPGDYHMTVEVDGANKVIRLNQGPPENFCRPAVDPMLRSVSKAYGAACLGVILTGMGHDGLEGGRVMVETGGSLIAQDQESSVVWGMPGAVATGGLCSAVLPLDDIPSHLIKVIGGTAK